jgi:enterochelin esterase-like enzyme
MIRFFPVAALLVAAVTLGFAHSLVPAQDAPRPRPKPPYETLETLPDASAVRAMLGGERSVVALEGDVLTFVHRSEGETVQLTGGIQLPMQRIPDTDLWVLRLRMAGWDRAFVSYAFFEPAQLKAGTRLEFRDWRGPNAPPEPEEAKELKGRIERRSFRSEALDQERQLTVYLPPNAPASGLPAFFMADGGGCEGMAKVLEPLILAGKVRPVAIVGVHSGENLNAPGEHKFELDHRAMEYLPGAPRYEAHMRFFADEVPAWATREFGISARREDRVVFGFSNGGSFSAGAVLERPHVFGAAIPMSVGAPPRRERPEGPLPAMHFVAGVLEAPFVAGTTVAYEQAKSFGAETSMTLYVAGHDWEMWRLAFVEFAPKLFPPDRRHQPASGTSDRRL